MDKQDNVLYQWMGGRREVTIESKSGRSHEFKLNMIRTKLEWIILMSGEIIFLWEQSI